MTAWLESVIKEQYKKRNEKIDPEKCLKQVEITAVELKDLEESGFVSRKKRLP